MKVWKKASAALLALCFALTLSTGAFAADVAVTMDGAPVEFTESSGAPFIDASGRTLVPLRAAMETYGCEVLWDNENSKAIVYKDGVTVVCPIGESRIEVNGESIAIDTAAIIKDGRTYLPIRCVLEAMGAAVGWDGGSRTVTVTRGTADVMLHQDEYLAMALAAADANSRLTGELSECVKAAVAKYLQNIPVDRSQAEKMCARLKTLQYAENSMGALNGFIPAGRCDSSDGANYTITMNLAELKDAAGQLDRKSYESALFHELCHMFSDITSTGTWFQEGMTQIFQTDIAEDGDNVGVVAYAVYYRLCLALMEIFGAEYVRDAYVAGDEAGLIAEINRCAGVTNAKSVLDRCARTMTFDLRDGIYTYMKTADKSRTKEDCEASFGKAAAEVSELLVKAYEGKTGKIASEAPVLSVYLSWLKGFNFQSTTQIMSGPTIKYGSSSACFNRSIYRSFYVINDASKTYCADGELVVYRD